MAFEKSFALMRLAEMAAARHRGVSLQDVMEEFQVTRRTAQRMIRGLEMIFPGVVCSTDAERRRWWKLTDRTLGVHQGIRDSELVALDMSIRRARREGAPLDALALSRLRERLLASMPRPHARRAEVDAAALLEAHGYAVRPGPRAGIDPVILGAITEAIKAPFTLDLSYRGAGDAGSRMRRVEPYGFLLGIRHYLVARDVDKGPALRRFRMDRIGTACITGQSFIRDPEFDLDVYAARSFGSFHDEREFGPVIWRFAPQAAAVARTFTFHPSQVLTEEVDGSLRVQFEASGWVEMVWHLYTWGDKVEVLAPEGLRDLVAGFRRGDLDVLP